MNNETLRQAMIGARNIAVVGLSDNPARPSYGVAQYLQGQGYRIRTLTIKPYEFSASPNQFFEAIARDAPRGFYPKHLYGEQSYWTVVGANGDEREGLLNEEGMIEVDKGAFSIEPFLYADGKLITWDSVIPVQELEEGYLPIPFTPAFRSKTTRVSRSI